MLRKVAGAAASNPHVEIRQDGEPTVLHQDVHQCAHFPPRSTSHIGEEFDEETVDGHGRKCKSLATWESENKIHCQQTLVDGDGPKTYWSRELNGDELILYNGKLR
ncbi:hypothetical protein L3Q82_007171 [Scortum barcoo]|uniref:Uncharacterized protein n=1 Tax=Scortum barcoo TaxID=214431 RepID=A0ACB8WT47_9TELE|nr:hypothetical protein L3Q82_007171 [Scortum barcoo]